MECLHQGIMFCFDRFIAFFKGLLFGDSPRLQRFCFSDGLLGGAGIRL